MEASSNYQDLIWAFTYERILSKQKVGLRIFNNESEIYTVKQDYSSATGFNFSYDELTNRESSVKRSKNEPLTPQTLQARGRELWELMPPLAKAPLLNQNSMGKPLRLKICSSSALLDDLPWEWLNNGRGQFYAQRPGIRLVRSIPISLPIPPLTITGNIRVLMVLTNPKDEELLNPYREIAAIRPGLDKPPYKLDILQEPTWEALKKAMEKQPHIVHYIGHAGVDKGEGNIILHNFNNTTRWISGQELAEVLPPSVRLLCLSTCFTAPNYQILGLSRFAHSSSTYRLPTTIINRYPLKEISIRSFWEEFYDSLLTDRGNVNEAFYKAQQAVASKHPVSGGDWGSFSLVVRDQSGESMQLGAVKKSSKRSSEKQTLEIQAQFASHFANELAESLNSVGLAASSFVQGHYEKASTFADNLTTQIKNYE